jgi:hypothetical protein
MHNGRRYFFTRTKVSLEIKNDLDITLLALLLLRHYYFTEVNFLSQRNAIGKAIVPVNRVNGSIGCTVYAVKFAL